jgi:hypothetical protein
MGLEAMDDMNRLRVTDKTKEITADIFPNADGGKLPRTPQGATRYEVGTRHE